MTQCLGAIRSYKQNPVKRVEQGEGQRTRANTAERMESIYKGTL